MESISPAEIAAELLKHCLRGSDWPEELLDALAAGALDEDPALAAPATRALFSVLVERLADLFEPALCDRYAQLFSRVLEKALPDQCKTAALVARYNDVRRVRPVDFEPQQVVVLSRVTLGADVAITSIVLDAARQRFPKARIVFAGPPKAWELFERDPRLTHLPISYGRGALLRDRLAVFDDLRDLLSRPATLVLDPDSRLTQLGLLPVCPPERHFLFESRSYGGDSQLSLSELTQQWVRETLGVEETVPYLHPKFHHDFGNNPVITVNFGVGENPAKRVEDPFEAEMLRHLASQPAQVIVDKGAPGSDEAARVGRAVAAAGGRVGVHDGSFASFAAMIAASSLYFGYDSAGQHVAAAVGVPLVSVFRGFASERMLNRWMPEGPGPIAVIRADRFDSLDELIGCVKQSLTVS